MSSANQHARTTLTRQSALRRSAWRPRTFRRSALEAAGIEVVPTFRTPNVTLAHAELDELLQRLSDCEHDILDNPYDEDESSPLET